MKTLAQPAHNLSETFFSGSFDPMPLSPEGAGAQRAPAAGLGPFLSGLSGIFKI